ncbi:Retrovirus-related Pol polyprotein from type-1 retrotransposable element, partial [Trichinella zimbabwensis]
LCMTTTSPRSKKLFTNPAVKFSVMDNNTGRSVEIPSLRASDTFWYLGHWFDGEGRVFIDIGKAESMLSKVRKAPLKPEQKVGLIRSHLLHRLQFWFSTPDANSRKAWLIDSIIRGGVKEILHSTKARISNDFFSIPCRDGGLGLTSRVLKFRAFSMPKALGRMADSSDPVSKRIAVFFRGEDAPSMKTFEATQKTFRNRRKARYGMTYQGRRFPEFQESTGNAWLRSGRARGRAPLPLDVKIAEAVD